MSASPLNPSTLQPPGLALPKRMRAGDQLLIAVATGQPAGSVAFFILSAIVANQPIRQRLGGDQGTPNSGESVADDGSLRLPIAGSTTAAWPAAKYQWVLYAVDAAGNRSELAVGRMTVDPDLDGAAPVDGRTQNEKLLANIKALLANKALDDVAEYEIAGRKLTKLTIPDLLKWEATISERVRRERMRRGERVPSRTLGISFGGR